MHLSDGGSHFRTEGIKYAGSGFGKHVSDPKQAIHYLLFELKIFGAILCIRVQNRRKQIPLHHVPELRGIEREIQPPCQSRKGSNLA